MLSVECVRYRSVPEWSASGTGECAASAFGHLLGEEIAAATASLSETDISFNICVSTMIDLPFASGWLKWPEVAAAAAEVTDKPPRNFTASYECAGWGFALEYARRRARPGSRIVITIADLNVLDFSFWRRNPNWGPSGFGVTTLVVRLPTDGAFPLTTKIAQSLHGMGEYCVDLRKWLACSPSRAANVPFLPAGMAEIYKHFLKQERLLPNLHDRYGHCFGSDTWLSYINHAKSGQLGPNDVYTATSASLRGYWAISDIVFDAGCRFELLERPGSREEATS